MSYFNYNNRQGGYIALMATIVISLVLLVMVVREGFVGWSTRFMVLGTEAKEQANALAEGCADQALAALITDPTYAGGSVSNTPVGTCSTSAIDTSAALVTIKTQAVVNNAYANLELVQNLNNVHIGNIPTAPTYGTLIVQTLVTNPTSGAQKTPADFIMQIAGPAGTDPISFPGSATGVIVKIPTPVAAPIATYSVSETPITGFAPSLTTDCSSTNMRGGDIKSCTVTNSPITTTVTLIANVNNNDGTGSAQPGQILMYIDGALATLGQAYTVTGGTHTVTATNPDSAKYSASAWGYQCTGSLGAGSVSTNVGENKICVINLDDNPPPAPICAETVMMLDRSYSMFGWPSYPSGYTQWIPDEKTAAKALVDLYASVVGVHPLVGMGRFGDLATGRSAEIVSVLSSNYAALKTAIDNALPQNPISYTNLAAAITKGSDELNGSNHVAGKEKVLILISDGDPNEPTGGTTASTGVFSPSANAQDSSGELWSNPANAYTNGVGEASDPVSENDQHRFYSFNFPTIPSNATIRGIEVTTDAWATTTGTVQTPANSQKSPTAVLAGGQWSTNTNAYTSNDVYATDAINNHTQGYGGFGFAIPSNATITGIQVTTEAKIAGSGSSLTTPTLYPTGQGSYNSWSGDDNDVDENGSPDCSSNDSLIENNTNDRESVDISVSSIPDGATITSVTISTYDRGDSNSGGTYKTFARLNNANTDAGANLTATGSSGCNLKTQIIDVPDVVKSGSTALEVGVIKVSGNNNTVRVGAIRATVTYTSAVSGAVTVALSSNNGGSWTSTKSVALTATESLANPSGNTTNDLWGRAWTPAEINSANFALRVQNTSATGPTVSLDQVLVNVFYTIPTQAPVACELGVDLSWNGSSFTSERRVQIGAAEAPYTFGSPSDDWDNHTWVPGDFTNGSNKFIVRTRSVDPGSNCDNASVTLVDWLQAEVTYTVPASASDAALLAADAAKKGPDNTAGTIDDVNIFTIHFGADPSGYPGRELLANLASGLAAVSGHQSGSASDLSGSPASSDTGLKVPTATHVPQNWSNAGNAYTSNNVYTTSNTEAQEQGYSNFGFGISAGATIAGIDVHIEAKSSDSSGCELQTMLSWNNGTNYTSVQSSNISGSDNTLTFGGSTNLWGRSWSASELSDANFVLKFRFDDSSGSNCNGSTVSVDQVQVRVYSAGAIPENGDSDNFFVSPTSADMKGIFEFIGNQVCPAINNVGASTPPTTANLIVLTRVVNNNSGTSASGNFTVSVTGTNPSPASFSGLDSPGKVVIIDPGNYSVLQSAAPAGYTQSQTTSCSSAASTPLVAGESRVCIITNDDIPPPPPPPNFTVTPGSWQEIPDTTP